MLDWLKDFFFDTVKPFFATTVQQWRDGFYMGFVVSACMLIGVMYGAITAAILDFLDNTLGFYVIGNDGFVLIGLVIGVPIGFGMAYQFLQSAFSEQWSSRNL